MRACLRVRHRVDGAMIEHSIVDHALEQSLVSRIKILASADIAERRRHQGGRIRFENSETGSVVDIRASFYVTIYG
jgi:type IV pilus assembly protein PilB